MEARGGDVGVSRAGARLGEASSSDGDLVARMAKTRRDLKVWETDFLRAHGRQPNKDDAAAAPGVKEMYGLYRSLKSKLDKENTGNACAGPVKPGPSAARSSGRPLVDARGGVASPRRDLARKPSAAPARVPVASRLPVNADSSDDDGDVVDATPVKAPTRVQPMRAAKSPSKSPVANPRSLPKARRSPQRSPKALRALFPDARALAGATDAAALPPRVAKKDAVRAVPANAFGRLAGGFGGGSFARLAEAKKPDAFEPLLCDARGVLDDGVLNIGADAPAMTLSDFLAQEPARRRGNPRGASKPPEPSAATSAKTAAAARPTRADAETKPISCSSGARKREGARQDVDPDVDEMLAAMEAEEADFDAAEARAAAAAARRRDAAAARTRRRRDVSADALGAHRGDGSERRNGSEDDEDYVASDASEDEDCAVATMRARKRKRASAAAKRPAAARNPRLGKPGAAAETNIAAAADATAASASCPLTGRERAEARNAAVAAAAEAKRRKPSGGRAKPAEATDWRAVGDEAPDRVPAPAKKRAASKMSKGNFVKMNLKRTWKSHGVKGGAKKSAGASHRYGGGAQSWNKAVGRRKQAPQPGEMQSVWSAGDWADRKKAQETPAEEKARAVREAAEDAALAAAARPGAAAAAAAALEAREKLEKPGPALAAACASALLDPTDQALTDILRRAFGHEAFRPGQLEVIRRVARGGSTLALLPTGAGKSLTYQLPALLFPGLTLVISPLLALMADQLRGLPPALPGAALRSDQSQAHLFAVLDDMRAGKLKVLFVSPERLLNERFLNDLRFVPGGVSLAVVDEAHCVSEWSHNFRPAYHRLGRILRSRLHMRGPVLALTATATARTETSLRATLDIPDEGAFRDDAIRANLTLSAMRVPASARDATLKHLLQREPMHGIGSVIVYVAFQNQAETVAAYLQTNGVNAKAYHAGQEPKDRQRTQAQFFAGSVRVVVATVAFGMGLDKADVRAVINYSLPRSPEAYIQQAGRAGRDGLPARCVSFIDADDFTRLRSLSFSDGVDRAAVHKLLETVFLGKDRKARRALAALEGAGGGGTGEARGAAVETGRGSRGDAGDKRDPNGNETQKPEGGDDADIAAVGALIVQQLEREMDMRGEVIETVLSCLELWDARVLERRCAAVSATNDEATLAAKERVARGDVADGAARADDDDDFGALGGNGLVRVLPDMRATCELSFHGASPESLASTCPLVAAVLGLGVKPKAGTYRFSVAAAARGMKSGLEEVGAQLQALSANGDAAYRLSDRAVGYEILRAPPADLRPLASALTQHLAAVERSAVHKLDTVYAALERAANAEDDDAQSASLRQTLEAYLRDPGGGMSSVHLSGVIASEAPRGLVADVRELLTHRSGGKAGGAGCMSARAVARVLHGLGSPAYPAAEWRRKEKAGHLWEKHSKVDFGAIVRVASEELLAMRGVVPKKKPGSLHE